MDIEFEKSLLGIIPVVVGVAATGVIGAGFGFWWNLQLKKREADLATAKAFHELYGEFFAVWKLWNYYIKNIGHDTFEDASRWKLLERACAAEGKMEAILIDLSSHYRSSSASLEILGQFRQVYQQLRQSIRDNQALKWGRAEEPVYWQFKRLAPVIAHMARTGHVVDGQLYTDHVNAWREVTSNRHENFWTRAEYTTIGSDSPASKST